MVDSFEAVHYRGLLTMLWSSQKMGIWQANYMHMHLHLLVLSALFLSTRGETQTISFPQFSASDQTMLTLGDAQYNPENHSFVLNSKSPVWQNGTCGILVYNGTKDMKLQDSVAGKVGTFNTSFTFRITTPPQQAIWYVNNRSVEELESRLSIVIVKSFQHQTKQVSSLERLNLTESQGKCVYYQDDATWFAVIFQGVDYDSNRGEPSNNFIGVKDGLNHQVYKAGFTHNLCGNKTYCSYLSNGGSFTAWIDFTEEQTLKIWLAKDLLPRNRLDTHFRPPGGPLLEIPNFKLPSEMGDNISVLFNARSAINAIETHEISSWNFFISTDVSTRISSKKISSKRKWIGMIFGIIGILVILSILSFVLIQLMRRRYATSRYLTGPCIFSYKELRKATKNFNEELGSGGCGTVYKGYLEGCDNPLVAVKRINYESKHAKKTFVAEISSLSQICHRNVVQLHGWCHEKGQLLLVYEYMPNGGLNKWLYGSKSNQEHRGVLSLKQRHHILVGVAAALEYLHKDCPLCILHRDIKSSNVMLDANFEAHLGDFGFARLMDHHKIDKTTLAAGTIGYMAPEMPYTGKATKESDVYSFGILLLEVICGRRPLDLKTTQPEDVVLLYYIWRAHEAGALLSVVDPRMCQTYQHSSLKPSEGEPNKEVQKVMVENLLHLGLLCCLPNPKARPTMEQVIQILQQIGNIDNVDYKITNVYMPPLPDTKPPGLYRSMEFSQTIEL